MVHPKMPRLSDRHVSEMIRHVQGGRCAGMLDELVALHMDLNSQVIKAIERARDADLNDVRRARAWAGEFLSKYDWTIRQMRDTSNKAFQLLSSLMEGCTKAGSGNAGRLGDGTRPLAAFSDGTGPLAGKIIFAYRELWFVARHVTEPGFEMGDVAGYQRWRDENLPNLIALDRSLSAVRAGIADKKE